jgi:hypothetical protein
MRAAAQKTNNNQPTSAAAGHVTQKKRDTGRQALVDVGINADLTDMIQSGARQVEEAILKNKIFSSHIDFSIMTPFHIHTFNTTQDQVIQRETVSGVTNKSKKKEEIGTDVHNFIQEIFRNSYLGYSYKLLTEAEIGNGRADLVAVNDEREKDGLGDLWIYVGEIKPESVKFTGQKKGALEQLNGYIKSYGKKFESATVGPLDFWNTSNSGYAMVGNGYNCKLFVWHDGKGLYLYKGMVKQKSIEKMEDESEEKEELELPFNEKPNYMFM